MRKKNDGEKTWGYSMRKSSEKESDTLLVMILLENRWDMSAIFDGI
jgi:hypothetical protein